MVEMPNVEGKTVDEAKKILSETGLENEINGDGEYIKEQLPKKGIQVATGTKVVLYTQ
jgi:beta-lactam-binding protein with PASTA domain